MFAYAMMVCVTLFFGWFYVWERLIAPASLSEPLRHTLLGFFVIAYALQAFRWLFFRVKGDLSWVVGPAYFLVGLLSHLFIATLLKDLVSMLWWTVSSQTYDLHGPWINSWVSYGIFFFCLAANIWGTQTAYEGPRVHRVKIPAKVPRQAARPLRVVQISDLHVGPLIRRPYVENVIEICHSLNPDLVVFTGDIGDGYPERLENDLHPFRNLKAPLGIYYVTGNHEYYWNVDGWIHTAKLVGMTVLFNHGVEIQHEGQSVWIAGVPDRSAKAFRPDHPHDVATALAGAPTGSFKILLAHQPHSIKEASTANADLVLSGHTHAGQYFPFNLVVGWFNPYSKDLHLHERTWIYVSHGTGFWGPPLRLGSRSEITLLELDL